MTALLSLGGLLIVPHVQGATILGNATLADGGDPGLITVSLLGTSAVPSLGVWGGLVLLLVVSVLLLRSQVRTTRVAGQIALIGILAGTAWATVVATTTPNSGSGDYSFSGVGDGIYSLDVTAPGYISQVIDPVVVAGNITLSTVRSVILQPVPTPLPPAETRLVGGTAADFGRSVTVDEGGNAVLAGGTSSSFLNGQGTVGGTDLFLTSHDATGTLRWTRVLGGDDDDNAFGVTGDGRGGLIFTGQTASSLFADLFGAGAQDLILGRYDLNGALQWVRRFGGATADVGRSVTADSLGRVAVTGWTNSSDFEGLAGAGAADVVLLHADQNGNLLWHRRLGGSAPDLGRGLAVDANGSLFIVGWTSSPDFEGLPGSGGADVFLAKYSASGVQQWVRRIGGSDDDQGISVAVDGNGQIAVTGWTASASFAGEGRIGGTDAFVMTFDAAGTVLWTRRFGSVDGDFGQGIAFDGSGRLLVTGYTQGSTFDGLSSAGGIDLFLTRFDGNGNREWTRLLGGSDDDLALDLAVNAAGDAFIAGGSGSSTIGGQTGAGAFDAVLSRFPATP